MSHESPLKIAPQQDVVTKAEAIEYIGHWKSLINNLYKTDNNNMPHGVFIPFTDIEEIANLRNEITHHGKDKYGNPQPIYIIGVRAYFCMKERVDISLPPVSAVDYPIKAMLVAVYQLTPPEHTVPEQPHEYPRTYDLLVAVPSVKDKMTAGDAGAYSIWDVTRPCPNLCDYDSDLFKNP